MSGSMFESLSQLTVPAFVLCSQVRGVVVPRPCIAMILNFGQIPSVKLGLHCILDRSIILGAIWRIHPKQVTLGRVCIDLNHKCEDDIELAVSDIYAYFHHRPDPQI